MTLANVDGRRAGGQGRSFLADKSPCYLSPGDGLKSVSATYADLSGAPSPTIFASITLDTLGPSVRVPGRDRDAAARRRRSAIA